MEPLHKLPMLYFDLKESHNEPDFANFLKRLIIQYYQEDPSSYFKEIKEFEGLRSSALKITHNVNGCIILKRYYAQLIGLQNRFRLSGTDETLGGKTFDLKFVWSDNLSKQKVTAGFQLELDSIFHNIGALHSELGAMGHRENSENMKVVCTHFQCAAWVYEKLRDRPYSLSKDLCREVASFNYQIMLAQAQECVFEKSILDGRKTSIIAKVSAQVVAYYQNILALLVQASLGSPGDSLMEVIGTKLFKEWRTFIEFKAEYYSAVTAYFMGQFSELDIGERIAWYNSAVDRVKGCTKLAKVTDRSDVIEAVGHLNSLIEKGLEQTKKENDFIYHQSVPSTDQLTAVVGVSLVKPISFSLSDSEISGKDLFQRLVPMKAYEQMSIYTERKDSMLRDIKKNIEEKNELLVQFLSVIQLDKTNIRERKFHVPKELVSACALLSMNPKLLPEAKEKLIALEQQTKKVDAKVLELEEKSKEYETLKKKIPDDLSKELKKIKEMHKAGSKSNENLKKSLDSCQEDIQLLTGYSVTDLENLFNARVSDLPRSEENLNELERLFDKVEEMRKQREKLEEDLEKQMQNDNILKKLLVQAEQKVDELFETELKKHDKIVQYIQQNLEAQEKIMEALTKANAQYSETRKAFKQMEKLRHERVEELLNSHNIFQQLVTHLEQGSDFFNKLSQLVDELLKRFDAQLAKKEEAIVPPRNVANSSKSNTPKLKDYLNAAKDTTNGSTSFPSQGWPYPSTYTSSTAETIPHFVPSATIANSQFQSPQLRPTGHPTLNRPFLPAAPTQYFTPSSVNPVPFSTSNQPVSVPQQAFYPANAYPSNVQYPYPNWQNQPPAQPNSWNGPSGQPPAQFVNSYAHPQAAYPQVPGASTAFNPYGNVNYPLEYQMQNMQISNPAQPTVQGTFQYESQKPPVSAAPTNLMDNDLPSTHQPVLTPVCLNPSAPPKDTQPSLL